MSKKKYSPRTPLGVKGGIRAQGAAAGPHRVWWSRRWTEVFEGFRLGARLGRGRSYALSGQVSALEIAPGRVIQRERWRRSRRWGHRCTLFRHLVLRLLITGATAHYTLAQTVWWATTGGQGPRRV